jgi:hypothetical protein
MKKIFILFALCCLTGATMAQQELNTHLLRGVWQSNRSNPALFSDHKLTIGLPGAYSNLLITGLKYNEIVSKDAEGRRVLDIDKGISQLDEFNLIRENTEIETLSLGLRLGKLSLSAAHSVRFNAFLNYPKTLPQLIWQGNAQFIGQEVNFGSDIQLFGFSELSVGAAYQVTKQLTIGGRAKLLSGLADISTPRTRLNLTTDEEAYELTLDADLQVNVTGSIDYQGFREPEVDFRFGQFAADQIFGSNTGYAFDLGAVLRFEKFDIAVSVLDLGSINWKDNARNYRLQGIYEYSGLDIAQSILDDSTTVGSVLDSLESIYQPVEGFAAYSTRLSPRFYLSASWLLTEKLRLGGVFYTEQYRGQSFPAIAFSATAQLKPWWSIGGSYGMRNRRFDNIGAHTALQVGPVQLVAATDNLVSVFLQKSSNSANLRLGSEFVVWEGVGQVSDIVN